uniref:Uncharacterized protein n=1 Tax=Lepeophtheirus salmonis TaxID=72036 RepID=A0A0K2UAV3_LEPSM
MFLHQSTLFTPRYTCNIEWMLVEEMPKDASISRYVTLRSCIITSRTVSMFPDTTAVFGRPSRNSFLSERRARLNSFNQFLKVL